MNSKDMKNMPRKKIVEFIKTEYVTLKLIPTKSNKNNTTDNIAVLINTMHTKLNNLITFEDKKLILKGSYKLSYYIHISRNDVSFYFIVPKVHSMKFKTKFSETWKNVEIKEVDSIPIDPNECTKSQLKYEMDDSLSLEIDKRNNSLLTSNLSILEYLKKDECVGIFYNFIPTGESEDNFFKMNYKDTIKRYNNGESLKKNKNIFDVGLTTVKNLVVFADDFVNTALDNQKKNSQIFISTKKDESPSTKDKGKSKICKTQIILFSKSNEKDREKQLCASVGSSFSAISGDNRLIRRKLNKNINIYEKEIFQVAVNMTSVDECSNFIALPGDALLKQFKNIEHKKTKENPIPDELRKGIINLGKGVYRGNKDYGYVSNEKSLQSLPLAIMGGSRSGKSTFSINMCKNIIDAGEGLIVIDFIKNTELAEQIKHITPTSRLIEIDLSTPKHIQSLSYNELKIKEGMGVDEIIKIARLQTNNVLQLVNIINSNDRQLAPKMRRYLGAAARIAFCNSGTSMKDIIKILQNHEVRHEFIDRLSDELKKVLDDSIITLKELDEYSKVTSDNPIPIACGTKENKIEGIIDRIDLLRENLVIDNMFSKDSKDNIDFVKAMEEGKVVLIRMRDIDFNDDTSIDILTTFFIQKIWMSTKVRGSIHEHPRRCTVLIDEIFQAPTSQKLLTKQFVQSAKFGLKYVLTLHYLDQLSKEAQAALKNSNASYMLISGVDKRAFEALEEEFEVHGYCLGDLLGLEQYSSLNLIKSKNGYEAFVTKLPPELKINSKKC